MFLCHLTIFIFNLPLCVCVCVCVHVHMCVCVLNCPVMSNSLWPHGLQPTRVLWPWGFPGKNTEVGCHYLPQGTSWPGTESMSLASPALAGRYFTLHHLGSRWLTSRVLENRTFIRFLDSIDLFPLPPISFSAGVQPRQDPGGTLAMNGIGKGRHVRPALIGPSLRGKEREWPDWGCAAESGNALFFTVAFIP